MELVTIKTFDNYFTANIILTRLQDSGISCFLRDEYSATVYPVLSNAIGGIKLDVEKQDAGQAIDLLKQFEEEYLRAVACPVCHSHNIHLVDKKGSTNFLTAILTWLFTSYAVAPEKIYQCSQCGYESKSLPENSSELN